MGRPSTPEAGRLVVGEHRAFGDRKRHQRRAGGRFGFRRHAPGVLRRLGGHHPAVRIDADPSIAGGAHQHALLGDAFDLDKAVGVRALARLQPALDLHLNAEAGRGRDLLARRARGLWERGDRLHLPGDGPPTDELQNIPGASVGARPHRAMPQQPHASASQGYRRERVPRRIEASAGAALNQRHAAREAVVRPKAHHAGRTGQKLRRRSVFPDRHGLKAAPFPSVIHRPATRSTPPLAPPNSERAPYSTRHAPWERW